MNSRDLLCAVAGIDESFVRESEQFSAVAAKIKAERQRERQKATAVVLAAAVCVAMFLTIKLAPPSFRLFAPSGVTNVNTPGQNSPSDGGNAVVDPVPGTTADQNAVSATAGEPTSAVKETEGIPSTAGDRKPSAPAGETTRRETATEKPVTEAPPATTAPEKPTSSEATAPPVPSTEPPTKPSTDSGEPGTTPGAVYSSVNVSYKEAKEIFGHPIVSCASGSFIGYQVGVVSRNGNIHESGAFCLSVTYRFSNGSINLQDQDRSAGSVAHNTGERYEYGGRTFYVSEGYADDGLYVGYFPTGDDGIAYQAFFDEDTDVYEIMDLMISVELSG